jgi:hypothetical protein
MITPEDVDRKLDELTIAATKAQIVAVDVKKGKQKQIPRKYAQPDKDTAQIEQKVMFTLGEKIAKMTNAVNDQSSVLRGLVAEIQAQHKVIRSDIERLSDSFEDLARQVAAQRKHETFVDNEQSHEIVSAVIQQDVEPLFVDDREYVVEGTSSSTRINYSAYY